MPHALPPAAAWKLGQQTIFFWVLCALGGLDALVWAAFIAVQEPLASGWQLWLGAGWGGIAAVIGWAHFRPPASAQLVWDGEAWQVLAGAQSHGVRRIHCVLDFQRLMVLQVERADGRVVWLWLASRAMDARWLAMRRALCTAPNRASRGVDDSLG